MDNSPILTERSSTMTGLSHLGPDLEIIKPFTSQNLTICDNLAVEVLEQLEPEP